ncbi:ABC transporter permease [uncultured Thiodictyon sp.]|uniref:ABC transporter permease n=1 Tax=uncultured Thiodictyon sp. TaxID=1846217 RepID=UPI0025F9125D|nr:ABC transporter permease [uncultured Thiodictyon sp.]
MSSDARRFRARKFRENLFSLGLSGGVFVLLFATWEFVARAHLVDPMFSSSPSQVLLTGWELINNGTLLKHVLASGKVFLTGFGLAVILGIPIGVALGWFKWFNRAFSPLVSAFYTMPRIALMPLFIIWFGLGMGSKVALILLSAIFPLIVNMQVAMQNIDADYKRVGIAYGANQWQLFSTVALPSSIPFLLTGLRLAMGRGLLGVVAAEVFGGAEGLGYMIQYAGATFQIDVVFVGVVVIATIGVIMDRSLAYASRRVDSWKITET